MSRKKLQVRAALLAALATTVSSSVANAQCCTPALTVQPKVIMEQEQQTRYRVIHDYEWVDSEVVSYRSVLKYRPETRQETVTRPVQETSTVEEKVTVLVPVKKQEIEDRSYYKTDMVTETSQREEVYTSLRPVVETQYQTQSVVVPRTITETQYQTQQYMTYSPVTTYQTATVDNGGYVAQNYIVPGQSRYRLGFLPGGTAVDTATGLPFYHRSQFGWVPTATPSLAYTALMYQPNPQQVAIPQTSLMPQVQQTQVPVQVTRTENELVQQQVPVQVTRYEQVAERRMVPYTTSKPVTQYIEQKVPVEREVMEPREIVRPRTITRTSYKTETVEKTVQVGYYEREEIHTPVRVRRPITKYVPETVTVLRPRTVYSPVTLNYYDPYSAALVVQGAMTPIVSAPAASPSDKGSETSAKKPEVKSVDLGEELPSKKDAKKEPVPDKTSEQAKEPEALDLNSASGVDAPRT